MTLHPSFRREKREGLPLKTNIVCLAQHLGMRRVVLVGFLLSTIALASCRPPSLYMVDPSGPPEYKLGWEDGCDSGLSAQGAMIYKMVYGFKKRPELSDNDLYKTAWNEGFTYCRFSLDPVDKSNWYN